VLSGIRVLLIQRLAHAPVPGQPGLWLRPIGTTSNECQRAATRQRRGDPMA